MSKFFIGYVSLTFRKNPALGINSPKVLDVANRLIPYDPSKHQRFAFIPHPYEGLLLHYPLIAAFWNTYKADNDGNGQTSETMRGGSEQKDIAVTEKDKKGVDVSRDKQIYEILGHDTSQNDLDERQRNFGDQKCDQETERHLGCIF